MTTTPQPPAGNPPRPAAAPARSSSLIWWIVGVLVTALVILGLGTALIAFYLARQVEVIRTSSEGVEIRTPAGTLRAGTTDKQETGLPEYPGARVSRPIGTIELAGDSELDFVVTAATYRTSDALQTVDEWYLGQLGTDFTREAAGVMVRKRQLFGVEVRSNDIAYIEEKDNTLRFVVLRREGLETEIVLARIGKQEVQ